MHDLQNQALQSNTSLLKLVQEIHATLLALPSGPDRDINAGWILSELSSRFHLTAETALEYCDENTIGVVAILG